MKFTAILTLASAMALASAIPNPWPAPTAAAAAMEERDASPMTCITDAHGTRCMPGRARRSAEPEQADVEARGPNWPDWPKHHSRKPKTTRTRPHHPATTPPPVPNGCFVDAVNSLTRCDNTVPVCTTFTGDDGASSVACVLKRGAAPEPTAAPAPAELAQRAAAGTRGWFSSEGSLCTVEKQRRKKLTRCVPNTPSCTTKVEAGETLVACVL